MNDDLTLIVGGRQIFGWTSIRITRGIERCPSDFELEMTELYPDEASSFVIQPGDACQVKLGDDLVITGYVDRFTPSISGGGHSIRVSGRSKCADLVDCDAEWPGGQITGSSVPAIAQKLAEPYGKFTDGSTPNPIKVRTDVTDVGPVIPQFNLMLGEKAFEIIERLCRFAALLAYDEPDGNLFLTRVSTTEAASGFQQGVNVQNASLTYSIDQRYSEVLAFIQSVDTFLDLGDDGNLIATVGDAGVRRHRRKIVIAESGDSDFNVAKRRADWEVVRRYGRSAQLTITTDGWRDKAGALYTPNTLVPVDFPALKLPSNKWLISEVSYKRDGQSGTTCDLVIMPPQAFSPQPILLFPVFTDVPAAAGK
ncbi:contractile injection system protein, VgrG/Pvc8 family [soil metagenome]